MTVPFFLFTKLKRIQYIKSILIIKRDTAMQCLYNCSLISHFFLQLIYLFIFRFQIIYKCIRTQGFAGNVFNEILGII